MGLDFSWPRRSTTNAPRWSYGGFHDFRHRLADAAGLGELDDFVGFGGERDFPDPADEPLVHLLNHSDCEGNLTAEQCAALAPRLREIVDEWDDDYDRANALRLAAACEQCARDGQLLEFT